MDLIMLMKPVMIPNSKKIKKNTGFVEKILSKPSPIKTPTIMGEIKSKLIFIPNPKPLGFFFLLYPLTLKKLTFRKQSNG